MARLMQTKDRAAPETLAVVKHELGHIDIRTGEIIDDISELEFSYVLIDPNQEIARGEPFLGTYFEYNPITKSHLRKIPTLSVNVLSSWEQSYQIAMQDIDVFCHCGNPSGVQTTCMETGDAVCNDCGNFIKG